MTPTPQLPTPHPSHPLQVGLRIMHRTTVGGTVPPRKNYRIDEWGRRVGLAMVAAEEGAVAAGQAAQL